MEYKSLYKYKLNNNICFVIESEKDRLVTDKDLVERALVIDDVSYRAIGLEHLGINEIKRVIN